MKDYSHIKEGMAVSLKNVARNSILEREIIKAFLAAGAPYFEGRDNKAALKIGAEWKYFGWLSSPFGESGTYFLDHPDSFNSIVDIAFILGKDYLKEILGSRYVLTLPVYGLETSTIYVGEDGLTADREQAKLFLANESISLEELEVVAVREELL